MHIRITSDIMENPDGVGFDVLNRVYNIYFDEFLKYKKLQFKEAVNIIFTEVRDYDVVTLEDNETKTGQAVKDTLRTWG